MLNNTWRAAAFLRGPRGYAGIATADLRLVDAVLGLGRETVEEACDRFLVEYGELVLELMDGTYQQAKFIMQHYPLW